MKTIFKLKKSIMYIKNFTTEEKATEWMRMKNRTAYAANGKNSEIYALVPSPYDHKPFAVVDLKTAIELGLCYKITYN